MSLRGTGEGGRIQRLSEVFEVLGSAGLFNLSFLRSLGAGVRRFGTTSAGGFHAAAIRNPNGIALIDEIGEMTFALSISAMNDAEGNHIGANLEWQNVTKQRAEAARAESLFSMIEGASSLFMTCDLDLSITYINPSLQEMLQKHERNIRDALPEFDLPASRSTGE